MYESLVQAPSAKFGNFTEAITALQNIERQDYEGSRFHITDNGKLKFTRPNVTGEKTLDFTEPGMKRMLQALEIPKGYAFKTINNSLLTENINRRFETLSEGQVITEKVKGTELVTGFRKDFIAPLRDFEVLQTLQNELSKSTKVRQLVRTVEGMRLHYFDPESTIEGFIHNNEAISVGGDFLYGEYGNKPLSANLALLIMWCTNGAVMPQEFFKSSYSHRGDRFLAANAIGSAVQGIRHASTEQLPEIFNSMRDRRPTDKEFRKIRNTVGRNFNVDTFDAKVNSTVSYWNMFNEITRVAHEEVFDSDNRRNLEVLSGGMILDSQIVGKYLLPDQIEVSEN